MLAPLRRKIGWSLFHDLHTPNPKNINQLELPAVCIRRKLAILRGERYPRHQLRST